jgi:hypothetical protein
MLPDDWRYQFIAEALTRISTVDTSDTSDGEDISDVAHAFADENARAAAPNGVVLLFSPDKAPAASPQLRMPAPAALADAMLEVAAEEAPAPAPRGSKRAQQTPQTATAEPLRRQSKGCRCGPRRAREARRFWEERSLRRTRRQRRHGQHPRRARAPRGAVQSCERGAAASCRGACGARRVGPRSAGGRSSGTHA